MFVCFLISCSVYAIHPLNAAESPLYKSSRVTAWMESFKAIFWNIMSHQSLPPTPHSLPPPLLWSNSRNLALSADTNRYVLQAVTAPQSTGSNSRNLALSADTNRYVLQAVTAPPSTGSNSRNLAPSADINRYVLQAVTAPHSTGSDSRNLAQHYRVQDPTVEIWLSIIEYRIQQ
jgi:hypothetical protein